MNDNIDKTATETIELFQRFSNTTRETWANDASLDRNFRYGEQWTEQDKFELEKRGQAPIVCNRINPAVETAKSFMTSKRPAFRVSPREDSDNQVAQAINGLLQYIWQISDGNLEASTVVDDFLTVGIGYWYPYIDSFADNGKGEVKFKALDPFDVYVDPNSRDPLFADATNIIVSRTYTKEQVKAMYPEFEKAISNASGISRSDYVNNNDSTNINHVVYPGGIYSISPNSNDEYIRVYERYTKIIVKKYRIRESYLGTERFIDPKQYSEFLSLPVYMVNGELFSLQFNASARYNDLMQTYQAQVQQYNQMLQGIESGQVDPMVLQQMPQPQKPTFQELTNTELIQQGIVNVTEISVRRVKMICVVGDKTIYERILPCEDYPIVPMCNYHTRTPYPLSDIRMVKDKQIVLNKTESLIISHTSSSTNSKLIVGEDADVESLKEQWAEPGAIIKLPLDIAPPIPVAPLPLPNELYQKQVTSKADIDYEFGIFESMMGNANSAPDTYKATIAMDEFGQRRIANKMLKLESSLARLGKVIIQFAQELYTSEKVIRIIEPNNSITEFSINKRLYDSYRNVIQVVNDVSRGNYDVIVVAGSTLPTNRYAQLEFYMNAYTQGIIDRMEVLKKTEVFDAEGVLGRFDEIANLQQQLQQAQEKIKQLSGDLQTSQRETMHANNRAMNAEHLSKLKNVELEGRKINETGKTQIANTLTNLQERNAIELEKAKLAMNKQQKPKTKE